DLRDRVEQADLPDCLLGCHRTHHADGEPVPWVLERMSLSRKADSSGVVVVTGASAGVGRATARRFAQEGASVALLARGADGLDGALRDVEQAGSRGLAIPTDVAD